MITVLLVLAVVHIASAMGVLLLASSPARPSSARSGVRPADGEAHGLGDAPASAGVAPADRAPELARVAVIRARRDHPAPRLAG